MNSPYHERGHLRAMLKPTIAHWRRWLRESEYRAFHRFARQLAAKPRFSRGNIQFRQRAIQYVDAPSFLSAWDEIFVNGIYDIPNPGHRPFLVDVGANIGLAAIRWKLQFGDFDYLGWEPDPSIANCCRENLRIWGVSGDVRNIAVGMQDGEAAFLPDGADGGRLVSEQSSSALRVSVERLSPLLVRSVDLLKIDVEGSELAVLREIASKLVLVRRLFVEWHDFVDQTEKLSSALAVLEDAGFRSLIQIGRGPAKPFLQSAVDDCFMQQINIFAVRR